MDQQWMDGVDRSLEALNKWKSEVGMLHNATETRFSSMETAVKSFSGELEQFSKKLDENTASTNTVRDNTDDLVQFTKSVKWLSKLSQPVGWVIGLAASFAALWVSLKGGK